MRSNLLAAVAVLSLCMSGCGVDPVPFQFKDGSVSGNHPAASRPVPPPDRTPPIGRPAIPSDMFIVVGLDDEIYHFQTIVDRSLTMSGGIYRASSPIVVGPHLVDALYVSFPMPPESVGAADIEVEALYGCGSPKTHDLYFIKPTIREQGRETVEGEDRGKMTLTDLRYLFEVCAPHGVSVELVFHLGGGSVPIAYEQFYLVQDSNNLEFN